MSDIYIQLTNIYNKIFYKCYFICSKIVKGDKLHFYNEINEGEEL